MAYGRKYGAQVAGRQKSALRQTGSWETHPGDCSCRKCRRMRSSQARRSTTKYGQSK